MEGLCGRRWEVDESRVVKPFRRYKTMRNNSMPDLTDLNIPHQPHAERQFIYNKWFIKPDQRLKRKPIQLRASLQESSFPNATPYFY